MQPSERAGVLAVLVAVVAAAWLPAGCSPQRLMVIDPDACDGGAGCGVSPGLLDGLIGYWRFDDGRGSASARDGSGRNNNGTLIELDSNAAWVAGHAGTALDFNAAGWVVVAPSASIDAIADRLTLCAWIYLDGVFVEDWGTAASRQIGDTLNQHYHLSLSADAKPSLFITTATAGALVMAPAAVTSRTWFHQCGTYDGTTARLYVDGALAGSQAIAGSFAADTTPLVLGGNGNGANGIATELFPGRLDEIMLYGRALGADEVSQLHAGALLTPQPPAASDASSD